MRNKILKIHVDKSERYKTVMCIGNVNIEIHINLNIKRRHSYLLNKLYF